MAMIGGWDGIEEFVAVAQAGSFTAGARAFGASVTHMSRAVARLEMRVQAQLFHRTTRSLRLTDTGRIFFEDCRRIVDEREEAIAAITRDGEPRGELRLTCSYALGEQFVAPLVREFAQGFPALSVTVDLDNDVIDLIAEGYDIAIRTGQLNDSRLIATRVAERALITCGAPDYLAAHGYPRTLAELSDHACLAGSSGAWRFRGDAVVRPVGRWRCNSGAAVLDAALHGMGICQLPAFYARRHVTAGRLIPLLEDMAPPPEPIWAVYPQRRHLSPKISQLVAMLRARLPARLAGVHDVAKDENDIPEP